MAQNYTLGRGKVYFGRFAEGATEPTGFRYIGNTPEFNLTIEDETLDHYSSDKGIREKDDSVPLEVNRSGSMTCDNIVVDNVALFFFGTTSAITTSALTSQSENLSGVVAGMSYQIGLTVSNPVGIRGVENVTVESNPAGTTYTLNTDYRLDADRGMVEIIDGGAITDGDDITVNYDIAASTSTRVISGSAPVEGAMRFIAANPKGADFDYFFPYVKITPNGDYALKGDEWQTIPFSLEILKQGDKDAIYMDGKPAYS